MALKEKIARWTGRHPRIVHFVFAVAVICNMAVLYFASQNKLHAYLATDIIGQTDLDGNVVFTTRNPNNNPPNNKGLNLPSGISEDPINHRLYIADSQNNRVLVHILDQNNNLLDATADFVIGQKGFNDNDVNCNPYSLNEPSAVLVIPSKNILLVADSANHRILTFNTNNLISGQRAVNVLGQPNFYTCSGPTNPTQNNFSPAGLAFDESNNYLYVSDQQFHRVLVFDIFAVVDNASSLHVLGQPDFNSGTPRVSASRLNTPAGLSLDKEKKLLYVTDSSNNRIMIFDVNEINNGEDAVNVLGQQDFLGLPAPLTQSGLRLPQCSALDMERHLLFVADNSNNRIMIFDVNEINNGEDAVNVLGQANFVVSTKNYSRRNVLGVVQCVAFNQSNKQIYVSDGSNNRILIFNTANIVNGDNAENLLGQIDANDQPIWNSNYVNNAPTNNKGLSLASGIALDKIHHRLFVSDGNNRRVLVFNLDEENNLTDRIADNVLGQENFANTNSGRSAVRMNSPNGLAYDENRDWLFVTDFGNSRIMVFDTATITNGESAIHVLGQINFSNNNPGRTQSTLRRPTKLYFNPKNNYLFVADTDNRRVMVFDTTTITNGQNAIRVLGQQTFSVAVAAATNKNFLGYPFGLTYDQKNDALYVADSGLDDGTGSRILRFDATTIETGESATHVLGQTTFISKDRAGATVSSLNYPQALTFDANNGILIVADTLNNRILLFDVTAINNGQDAVAVIGQPNFTSHFSALPVNKDSIVGPAELHYDEEYGRLYASDNSNYRVNIYRFVRPTGTYPNGAAGTIYQSPALQTINAQGNVSFRLREGSLPPGLKLNSNGSITGIPALAGNYEFIIQAVDTTDTGQFYGTAKFNIDISKASVGFKTTTLGALESLSKPIVQVSLKYPLSKDVTVNYEVTGGTATMNTDYILNKGTLTIPAGQTNANLPLTIVDDNKPESDETIQITLSDPTESVLGANSVLTYTIINADTVEKQVANQSPLIFNVFATSTSNIARVTWQSADDKGIISTEFNYGLNMTYGNSANPSGNLVDLTNLAADQTYYFQITVTDAEGSRTNYTSSVKTLKAGEEPSPHTPDPPPDIKNFQINAGTESIALTWEKPQVPRFLGVRIMRKTDGKATTANDGSLIYSGSGVDFADTRVNVNTPYYYTAFAYNEFNEYSPGVFVSATIYKEICGNNIDDDQNGLADCLDPACANSVRCLPETPTPVSPIEELEPIQIPEVVMEDCGNSLDDDDDGLIDCADQECQTECQLTKEQEQPLAPDTTQETATSFKLTLPPNILGLTFKNDVLTGLSGTKFKLEIPLSSFPSQPKDILLKIQSETKSFFFLYDYFEQKYITNVELPETGDHTGQLEIQYLNGQNYTYQFKIVCLNVGFVKNTAGDGVPNVEIALYQAEENSALDTSSSKQTNLANSAADGSYSLIVPDGDYYLVASKKGYKEKTIGPFTVTNNIVNLDITMERASMILENITTIIAPVTRAAQKSTQAIVTSAKQIGARLNNVVQNITELRQQPQTLTVIGNIIAPAAIVGVAATTLPFIPFHNVLNLLYFISLRPFSLFVRKKKYVQGEIYDSLTKLPISFAVVRLINTASNRVVRSRVSDQQGRYSIPAKPGEYRLVVTKSGWTFPTSLIKDLTTDGQRTALYFGETFTIAETSPNVSYTIPLDKLGSEKIIKAGKIKWNNFWKKLQLAVSLLGLTISVLSAYAVPSWHLFVLLLLQVLLFTIFWYLGRPRKIKNWGLVFDANNNKPLANFTIHLFNADLNKLVASTTSDRQGKYYFNVGKSKFYLLCEAPLYENYKSPEIDLTTSPTIAHGDIPMRLVSDIKDSVPPTTTPTPPPPQQITTKEA